MNKSWFVTNLEDALQELNAAVEKIKLLDPDDDVVAQQLISEAYIKLNYAWNSRNAALDSKMDSMYDEWIKHPKEMDIYTGI